MAYVYELISGRYEVGFYGPDNRWKVESAYDSYLEAARRVSYLNGNPAAEHAELPQDAATMFLTASSQALFAYTGVRNAVWAECEGCGWKYVAEDEYPRGAAMVNSEANDHAAKCRRVPIPGRSFRPLA